MLVRKIAFACAVVASLALAACSKENGSDGTEAVSTPTVPPPGIANSTAASGVVIAQH